jgi:hypothetical protein
MIMDGDGDSKSVFALVKHVRSDSERKDGASVTCYQFIHAYARSQLPLILIYAYATTNVRYGVVVIIPTIVNQLLPHFIGQVR